MTAPSQTPEAAGLVELIESRIGQDFDGECHLTEDEARSIIAALVTAASAQARIAELEAKLENVEWLLQGAKANFATAEMEAAAEKARADKLAKALEEIRDLGSDGEHSGDRHARCRSIARAALQQEG